MQITEYKSFLLAKYFSCNYLKMKTLSRSTSYQLLINSLYDFQSLYLVLSDSSPFFLLVADNVAKLSFC